MVHAIRGMRSVVGAQFSVVGGPWSGGHRSVRGRVRKVAGRVRKVAGRVTDGCATIRGNGRRRAVGVKVVRGRFVV